MRTFLEKGGATSSGGGTSMVDIVVGTPGRIVDHIESTPNFTLKHLRFLVFNNLIFFLKLSICFKMIPHDLILSHHRTSIIYTLLLYFIIIIIIIKRW
jgi:hypothetical protein